MKELIATIKKALAAIDKLTLQADSFIHPGEDRSIEEHALSLCFSLRETSITLYRLSSSLLCPLPDADIEAAYKGELLPLEAVYAHLMHGVIYLRTPMLAGRQSKSQIQSPREKDIMFSESVQYAIQTAAGFAEYDFSVFANKLISFLFVYDMEAYRRGYIVDTDNHEVKFIIDAIAQFLPGGDSPRSTSLFMSTAITDKIPSGTYISVTPTSAGTPSAETIISFWNSALADSEDA